MDEKLSGMFTSRFILQSDPRIEDLVFAIPPDWWSRHYEYAWASQFARSQDTVLDAACGIFHPFKFFLTDKCLEVHACDQDEKILSPSLILQEIITHLGQEAAQKLSPYYFHTIRFAKADIANLPYPDGKFDKIFCISVLEHLEPKIIHAALSEFRRTLKDNGLLILTVDYPAIQPEALRDMAAKSELSFANTADLTLPENAIFSDSFLDVYGSRLYCYRTVLKKQVESMDTKRLLKCNSQGLKINFHLGSCTLCYPFIIN